MILAATTIALIFFVLGMALALCNVSGRISRLEEAKLERDAIARRLKCKERREWNRAMEKKMGGRI